MRNQGSFWYQKNSLKSSYDNRETSNFKTRRKNNKRLIYSNMCIIPTFFRPVQTLCNLVPLRLSLTLMLKSKKTLRPRSRPSLTKGLKVLFRILFEKSAPQFYSNEIWQKRRLAHTFRSLDCNFSFCTDFLHRW